MSPPRSRRAVGIITVVVGVVIGLGVSCNGFREDEVECEQSVVRLKECCPGFNTRTLDCTYNERLDCNDSVTAREYPAISLEDSRCLQKKTCSALVASGDCGRAQDAKLRVVGTDTTGRTTPQERICAP